MHRILRSTIAALVLAPLLSGCGGFMIACPAIGYLNTLEVGLSGARSGEVALVELCDEFGCSVPGPTAAADPPTAGPWYSGEDLGTGAWRFTLDMSAPEEFELIAYGPGVTELARESFTAEWHRVGGSAKCGGPMATGPVEFVID
ncbi:hypothetical protein FLP10_04505 [Agromyces intestinalis]|uniref:Uncharacterized protein n=1 Tax=Agromyces intestinalis TaxID=2592652 RepID=A0A5C1YCE4_9MICO|nr:hypothetical protein [Agromyces intestinalis]QEO13763.1 hypothetical protein FLP10_04505 [Agromyces intestinalis]